MTFRRETIDSERPEALKPHDLATRSRNSGEKTSKIMKNKTNATKIDEDPEAKPASKPCPRRGSSHHATRLDPSGDPSTSRDRLRSTAVGCQKSSLVSGHGHHIFAVRVLSVHLPRSSSRRNQARITEPPWHIYMIQSLACRFLC